MVSEQPAMLEQLNSEDSAENTKLFTERKTRIKS